jgi:hypothetical protein
MEPGPGAYSLLEGFGAVTKKSVVGNYQIAAKFGQEKRMTYKFGENPGPGSYDKSGSLGNKGFKFGGRP